MRTTENYFVIAEKDTGNFQADFRRVKFVANKEIQYYRTGDLTSKLVDSYLFEDEEVAKSFLENNLKSNENFEVRGVVLDYEII